MMKNFKRVICFLLSVSMFLALAVSCSEKKDAPADESQTTAVTEAADENLNSLDKRMSVSDGLPADVNFDGEEFLIIVQGEFAYDAGVEEITGDALKDEIFNRNQRVSERFNTDVKWINGGDSGTMSNTIRKTVNSDDDVYELCMAHTIQTGADITGGIFSDWMNFDYIDLSSPWYPQYAIEACTVNGKLYALVSDATITSAELTCCVYFNKDIASDYGIESGDFYSLVRDKKWTIDKMHEYVKLVYSDVNGNGKKDSGDTFGNVTMLFYSYNALWAFEQPICKIENDEITLTLETEKTVAILDRLHDFYYNNEGTSLTGYQASKDRFAAGESLFLICQFFPALNELRAMEQDYGIIPYPKWDEAQEIHKSVIDGAFDLLVVPVTVPLDQYDRIGITTQGLSADSWKQVQPVFYDVALKVKGTRDEESVEMIDIILNGRVVDFSWLYSGWNGFNFIVYDMLNAKKGGGEFASEYQKQVKSKTRVYENLLEFFYK